LSHSLISLYFNNFSDKDSYFFLHRLACTIILLSMPPIVSGITNVPHHVWLVCWDRVSLTFWLDWPQTSILPVSASWIARIIILRCEYLRIYLTTMWIILILYVSGEITDFEVNIQNGPLWKYIKTRRVVSLSVQMNQKILVTRVPSWEA
jgi:hypothetical protein